MPSPLYEVSERYKNTNRPNATIPLPMPDIKTFFANAFALQGRARRIEYAVWLIYATFAHYGLYKVCELLLRQTSPSANTFLWLGATALLFAIFVLVPFLCAAVRRHHDFGRSGKWVLMFLVPLWGYIWAAVIAVIDTEPRDNAYGVNPKAHLLNT